jgi:hypothetical protein
MSDENEITQAEAARIADAAFGVDTTSQAGTGNNMYEDLGLIGSEGEISDEEAKRIADEIGGD